LLSSLRAYFVADPLIILSTIVFGSVSVIVSLFDSTGDLQIRVARAWAKSLLLVSGVSVEVQGLENIDPSGSYVFASNHLSYMDTPVVLAHIPMQFRFLAKRGLFKIPLLGTHLGQAGHIPVPRDDPRASIKTMQTAAEVMQNRKVSLLIFPEGGRSHDGRLQPFKEGAAYIAIRAGAPLVPVAIVGTEKVLPFGSGTPRPGKVLLKVMRPLQTQGRTLKQRHELTTEARTLIAAAIEEGSGVTEHA
jgi:1-acyl-sn-glycerol-3-phosphate acyltransferase